MGCVGPADNVPCIYDPEYITVQGISFFLLLSHRMGQVSIFEKKCLMLSDASVCEEANSIPGSYPFEQSKSC